MFCCQVLPDDMVVLAEPDPGDMLQAIKKAISIIPMIDSREMHNRVSAFFEGKKKKTFLYEHLTIFICTNCVLSQSKKKKTLR